MTLETRLIALAQAIGADVKTLTQAQGSLTALTTAAKTNLVAAINELVGYHNSRLQIDDAAGDGAANVTWSADKIFDAIAAAKSEVKDSLLNGASAALDTLKELSDALGNDPSFATNIANQIAARVRFDAAQTLSPAQQVQARDNIGAAAAESIGDPDRNYAAEYAAAKV